jgi:hypothetical protein
VNTRRGRKCILLIVSCVSTFGGPDRWILSSVHAGAMQHVLQETGHRATLIMCACVIGPVRNFVCDNNNF